MSSYKKNVYNQSGVSVDTLNVNTLATLPKSITVDSTNGLKLDTLTLSSVVVANGGIQLPSTNYIKADNYLGYQPTVIMTNNRMIIPNGTLNRMATIFLTPGTYIVRSQIEMFAFLNTSLLEYKLSLSTDEYLFNPLISNTTTNYNNIILNSSTSIIQELNAVINIAVDTTYYLMSYINYSNTTGGIILKTTNVSVTATTINAAQSGTTITLTAYDSTIKTGMLVIGGGNSVPSYFSTLSLDGVMTVTTSISAPANTVLTFSHSNCASSVNVVRIA